MPNILIPIAVSSQLDSSGEERIHAAGYIIGSRTILPLSLSGDMEDATLGTFISGSYTAHGGVPPYTYSISAGALPDGITMLSDGTYSGTLTGTGVFSWSVDVEDSTESHYILNDSNRVTTSKWLATNPNDAGTAGVSDLMVSNDFVTWDIITRSPAAAATQTRIGDAGGRAVIFRRSGTAIEFIDDIASGNVLLSGTPAQYANDAFPILSYEGGQILVSQRGQNAVGTQLGTPQAFVSFDYGVTWTAYNLPYNASNSLVGRLFRMPSGRWVVNGASNFPAKTTMYYTDNAVPTGWITVSLTQYSGVNRDFYSHMQHENGRVVVVTNGGDVAYTDNGSSWTLYSRAGGLTYNSSGNPAAIAIGDVMLNTGSSSGGGTYFRSTDAGASWSQRSGVAGIDSIIDFAYGNGLVVGWNSAGTIYKSTDLGLTWTTTTLPNNRAAPAIGFVSGLI